jgi:hypothetical protein
MMPTSYTENIPSVMSLIEKIRPSRVLDVGPGYGKYGFLMRERLDNFEGKMRIDCIDPFNEYLDRSEAWKNIYDLRMKGVFPDRTHVWQFYGTSQYGGGIDHQWRAFDPPWIDNSYDLVLMIDVLEHYAGYDESGRRSGLRQRCSSARLSASSRDQCLATSTRRTAPSGTSPSCAMLPASWRRERSSTLPARRTQCSAP